MITKEITAAMVTATTTCTDIKLQHKKIQQSPGHDRDDEW